MGRGSKTYSGASAYCRRKGGKLFEPKNKRESDKVRALAKSKGVGTCFWIGINDKARENHFVYESDGKAIDWKNWNGVEPSNSRSCIRRRFGWCVQRGDEDCVEAFTSNGEWNDKPCNKMLPFVCEIE